MFHLYSFSVICATAEDKQFFPALLKTLKMGTRVCISKTVAELNLKMITDVTPTTFTQYSTPLS